MKKYLILIIFIFLTGCYNYRELNDLALVSAIGISKVDNTYKLTIQVLDTTSKDIKFVTFNTEGTTIQEALRNTISETSKRLFINHMQILLIDHDLAQNGIKDIIDFFFRDPESRKDFKVLIADSPINEILNTKTPLEIIPGKNINNRLDKNNIFLNNTNNLSFNNLLKDYLNPYKQMLITSIKLDNTELLLDNSYIFDKDKIIDKINKQDVIYYNYITNNIEDTLISFPNLITLEVIDTNTNIKVNQNNINILINIKATINDINYNLDLNTDTLNMLENTIQSYLNNDIYNSVTSIYKISDIYGLKDYIYKNDYKYFINNQIDNINIKVNTKINIIHKGNGDYIYENNKPTI